MNDILVERKAKYDTITLSVTLGLQIYSGREKKLYSCHIW